MFMSFYYHLWIIFFSISMMFQRRKLHDDLFPVFIIVLKPGQAGQPGTRLTWGWNRAGLKKKAVKNPTDPTGWLNDPVDLTRFGQKLGYNPFTIFFFTKTISYLFIKKLKLTRVLSWIDHQIKSRLKTRLQFIH
jgi:hypothetical protein